MLTNGFPEEIKRLCSLLCSDGKWFCWIHSRTEAQFISSETLRLCTVEERVLLKNIEQQASGAAFSLPDTHAFVQLAHASGKLLFLQHRTESETLLIALPAGDQLLLERIVLLILDRKREWQLRQQLSRIVEQQQQQIRRSEERFQALHRQREEQLRQLIANWAVSRSIAVVPDASLHTCFDFALTDTQVREQLENALQLAQFIQPGAAVYELLPVHIQPVESVARTPVNAPLSGNQRVELLLDKYEASARAAQQKGFAVNGKTIAENLQPSISPPAITDALKKNRKAIAGLLEHYPEKWLLLRKHLKPVKELSERSFYRSFGENQ